MSKCSWTSYLCALLVRACRAIRESGNLLGQEQRCNGKSSSASVYFRVPELWAPHFSALHWNHSRIVYVSKCAGGSLDESTHLLSMPSPLEQNALLVIAWNTCVNIALWISVWRNAKRRLIGYYQWSLAISRLKERDAEEHSAPHVPRIHSFPCL